MTKIIENKKTWEELFAQGVKIWQLPKKERPAKRIVGVVPDLHIPYQNPKALDFLVETFVRRGVTDIVFIGDVIDAYWYGHKYLKDYNIIGPRVRIKVVPTKVVPFATFIIGNHDLRIVRRR